ncbi:MAG: twin-arginine translocation signal domain-containing protein [Bacillota bacterium]
MKLSRRDFLKLSGAAVAAANLASLGFSTRAHAQEKLKIHYAKESTTVCCYCSGGCGIILYVNDGEIISLEGDPDHPINEGGLCSKANAMVNLRNIYDRHGNRILNPNRLTHVLYRAPGSDRWEEKSWDWALSEISQRVKDARDSTFETTDENGVTVNRTFGIGHLGSAAVDNEENYLMHKLMRSLGIVNMDHHARL